YYIKVPRVNGFVRTYASIDELNENLNVILINKNDTIETVNIKTSEFKLQPNYTVKTFSGQMPEDVTPVYTEKIYNKIKNQILKIELAPLSLNVIAVKLN
ncbi:MAG: hypothetical protein ABJG40_03880, partial [Polaribacter sp.]